MAAAGKLNPTPEVHIRADAAAQYGIVARVMAAAARSGLTKIGFVSDPNESAPTR